MFNLGLFELTLFGIIALIVLGPEKLPQTARTLGKWYAFAMHAKNRLTRDVMSELNLLETQRQIQEELANIRRMESEMQARMDKLQGAIRQNERQFQDDLAQNNKPNTVSQPSPQAPQNKDKGNEPTTTNQKTTQETDQPTKHISQETQDTDAWSMVGAFAEFFEPKPMTGHFFVLGDYDKKRRLPNAPFLPNYQADKLLFSQ